MKMINIDKLISKAKFYIRFKKCPFCKHYISRSSKNHCCWCGQEWRNRIDVINKKHIFNL